MRAILKQMFSLAIAAVLLLSALPGSVLAADEVASGVCGDGLTWSLNRNGVLTIKGAGPMAGYGDGYDLFGYGSDYCYDIYDVVIEPGVTSIGTRAFYLCTNLTSIVIPDTVTAIGSRAFSNCYSLSSPVIPDSVTIIGEQAFSNCSNLRSMTIPERVETIGDGAFSSCVRLERIVVEGGNAAYSSADGVLFSKDGTGLIACPGGKSGVYSVPAGVLRIHPYAFAGCQNLTKILIPAGVESINESSGFFHTPSGVFQGSTNLTEIQVAADNSQFISRDGVLLTCSSLTDVVFCRGITTIGYCAFSGCYGLTSMELPRGITYASALLFNNCIGLQRVVIPEGVDRICNYAFLYCLNLTDVTIPASVTHIDSSAFMYCDNLRDVWYGGSQQDWDALVIDSGNEALLKAELHFGAAGSPVITAQPVDYAGPEGSTAAFTVVAEGAEPLTYRWWIRNPGENDFSLSTRKTATYSTTLKAANNGRELYCVVSDAGGNSVTSDTVTMTTEGSSSKATGGRNLMTAETINGPKIVEIELPEFDLASGLPVVFADATFTRDAGVTDYPRVRLCIKNSRQLNRYSTYYKVGEENVYAAREWRTPAFIWEKKAVKIVLNVPEGCVLTVREMGYRLEDSVDRPVSGVRFFARPGTCNMVPELTVPAMQMASRAGYDTFVIIPKISSDGVWFAYHDDTWDVSTTQYRNMDGTVITDTQYDGMRFDQIPFDYLLNYSAGYQFGPAFYGVKTMRLEDGLAFLAKTGMKLRFSMHPSAGINTAEKLADLKRLVQRYGLLKDLTIIVNDFESLYAAFGNDVGGYCFPNKVNSSWDEGATNRPEEALEKALAAKAAHPDISVPISCGLWTPALFSDRTRAEAFVSDVLDAGFTAEVFNHEHVGIDGGPSHIPLWSEDIRWLMSIGVTGFTDGYNSSIGLNW